MTFTITIPIHLLGFLAGVGIFLFGFVLGVVMESGTKEGTPDFDDLL